ncbi:hypothetical protein QUF64_07460 [Anaerolineales bacterium HSG6]|nr:hypothetical protein [Anaerolineales bacterium HSG6]MDM8529903.1 hypothetical protein [Anaerolineales bacterium HSG25]
MTKLLHTQIPKIYQAFLSAWQNPDHKQRSLNFYQTGTTSFVPNLLPEQAMQLSPSETISLLRDRLGNAVDVSLSAEYTDPNQLSTNQPPEIATPVANNSDGSWLKQSNMVGINVRTIRSFWHIINYLLTIPAAQDSVHLLPIWEPGVVGSLYGMSSWQINPEFYNPELADLYPHLNCVEKQLKAVINMAHVMGKTVGMDVIPHTDRYSEIVLAHPQYFEWLQREDITIVDHADTLHEDVQTHILQFLKTHNFAVIGETLPSIDQLFTDMVDEAQRLRILFGEPDDFAGRAKRRNQLVKHLHSHGYEPVPATMGPPYRGLKVDHRPTAERIDENGQQWRDYLIKQPQAMSRVFGPLTRYKLYGRHNNNADWEIDFAAPRMEVWHYLCDHYYQVQHRYGFDFMRGDMSHVQMRPNGVPENPDQYYDPLKAVKHYIQQVKNVPYFGYFAETFLAPRDSIAYGDEVDHLEASDAETTLGDLQSLCVGTPLFLQKLRHYYDLAVTRAVVPNFTVMTADKDDPRFDEFYRHGNRARLFIALFLTDMPSYMGLGFESRERHYKPAPNEHYTKLYVFQESEGEKATHGAYRWGRNGALYHAFTRLKLYADQIFDHIKGLTTLWLVHPDPTGASKIIAWTQSGTKARYIFVVNTDPEHDIFDVSLPPPPHADLASTLKFEFSTHFQILVTDQHVPYNGRNYKLKHIAAGEGRVYII